MENITHITYDMFTCKSESVRNV